MASTNAILFTIIITDHMRTGVEHLIPSRFGVMALEFSSQGLLRMGYLKLNESITEDSDVHNNWNNWLDGFTAQNASDQWKQLSPNGTAFQKLVWRSLLEIPLGAQLHYSEIASRLGRPKSSRAVATAIAANPIFLLIPCHRVVPLKGGTGQYKWGAQRKQQLLSAEAQVGTTLNDLFR